MHGLELFRPGKKIDRQGAERAPGGTNVVSDSGVSEKMKPSSLGMIVFGFVVVAFGLGVALTPLGQRQSTVGVTGALGIPMWIAAILLVLFGLFLIVSGLRKRKSGGR